MSQTITKTDRIENFIKAFHENEMAMKPFKEFRSDLRKNYVDNGWLTRQELSTAIKVYRFLKSDIDYSQFHNIYTEMEKKFGE
tara:strand:+ start:851 stop:1099 length:249 start_codon:yes stop_codon:yes gene_type:complete